MTTIYRVNLENGYQEFADYQLALECCEANLVNPLAIEQEERDCTKPKIIPDVSRRQFKQAAVLSGLSLSEIEGQLMTMDEPKKSLALIAWNDSLSFVRREPMVEQLGSAMGLNTQQLDDLWELASTL